MYNIYRMSLNACSRTKFVSQPKIVRYVMKWEEVTFKSRDEQESFFHVDHLHTSQGMRRHNNWSQMEGVILSATKISRQIWGLSFDRMFGNSISKDMPIRSSRRLKKAVNQIFRRSRVHTRADDDVVLIMMMMMMIRKGR